MRILRANGLPAFSWNIISLAALDEPLYCCKMCPTLVSSIIVCALQQNNSTTGGGTCTRDNEKQNKTRWHLWLPVLQAGVTVLPVVHLSYVLGKSQPYLPTRTKPYNQYLPSAWAGYFEDAHRLANQVYMGSDVSKPCGSNLWPSREIIYESDS